MSLISVIVPVYNVEQYLNRCVDSVLAQTFTDFDLILIDDGSPDRCGEICDEYANKDERVHVIHQDNKGISAARNAGLDWALNHSKSEWITFIDSDDWVHKDYLKCLFYACIDAKAEISLAGHMAIDNNRIYDSSDDDYSLKIIPVEDVYFQRVSYHQLNCITSWGKLFRKKLWKNIRFPEGKIHEDRFTTHLLFFQTDRIVYFTAPLYYYFERMDSISNLPWAPKRLDDIEAVKQQIRFFEEKGFIRIRNKFIKEYFGLLNGHYIASSCNPIIQKQLRQEYFNTVKKIKKDKKWLVFLSMIRNPDIICPVLKYPRMLLRVLKKYVKKNLFIPKSERL